MIEKNSEIKSHIKVSGCYIFQIEVNVLLIKKVLNAQEIYVLKWTRRKWTSGNQIDCILIIQGRVKTSAVRGVALNHDEGYYVVVFAFKDYVFQ